jgi:hypothetical protein
MSTITFFVEVEVSDDYTVYKEKLDQYLSDLEESLMSKPDGFGLYHSEWFEGEG